MPASAAPSSPPRTSTGRTAAAGTAAGLAGTAAPSVAPPGGAALLTAAGLAALLDGFFRSVKARNERWLRALYSGRPRARGPGVPGALGVPEPGGVTQQDVNEAVAAESARQSEYQRKALARLHPDVEKVLALRDPEKQATRLDEVLSRETRYAQQRAEEMARRALSAIDRSVLRRTSPRGATWHLGKTKNHTEGCLLVAGRSWPWEALRLFSPPGHPGCDCYLSALRPDEEPLPLARALPEMRLALSLEGREH